MQNSKDQFFLVLGGSLWRINDETKTYETYSQSSDSWESMRWLKDKLDHEVECAKHHGQHLSYEEALKTKENLRARYLERIKK